MRHRKRVVKLGRTSDHRKFMLSNMAASLIVHKRIQTTLAKAHAVVPVVNKLITWAKDGSLQAHRLAYKILRDRDIVGMLFKELPPAMGERNGGYTRILKAGIRKGDSALMVVLELVGMEPVEDLEKKKKKKNKKEQKPLK